MSDSISLHRVEHYCEHHRTDMIFRVKVSFETCHDKYYYAGYVIFADGSTSFEQGPELDLTTFSKSEQYYIECVCAIVLQVMRKASMPDFDK